MCNNDTIKMANKKFLLIIQIDDCQAYVINKTVQLCESRVQSLSSWITFFVYFRRELYTEILPLRSTSTFSVADLGEGPGGARAPSLFWQKNKWNKIMKKRRRKKSREGKRYSQINFVSASQKNRSPPLAQGLDPPLLLLWQKWRQTI